MGVNLKDYGAFTPDDAWKTKAEDTYRQQPTSKACCPRGISLEIVASWAKLMKSK